MVNNYFRLSNGRPNREDLIKQQSSSVGHLVADDFFEAGGAPTYFGILKRWTGATWVKAKLKTYLGGSFVEKPLKRWDGSQWRLIDTSG